MKTNNFSSLTTEGTIAAIQALPALDPDALGDMAANAEQALLAEGESANTLRSYRGALRYWQAWFALRYRRPIALPVAEATVIQFIVDHAQRADAQAQLVTEMPAEIDAALVSAGYKGKPGPPTLNTVCHRIAVLSKVHQVHKLDNPCAHPRVRELLAKSRRAYAKRGALPRRKPALTIEPMQAMLRTCDASLAGLRDRALLLFAFSSGGRRRSEVTAATMENTRRDGDRYVYTLLVSKTNPFGTDRPENDKPVVGQAAQALTAWLEASQIRSGPIFRRVRRGDVIGEPLSPSAVRDIVRKRCALAGLSEEFSAHSLRSGFVTEAGRRGIALGETMAMTGHRSMTALVGYFRPTTAVSPAATLMDDPADS